ncbi:ribosome-associated protein [Aestuariibacter halophilus]|uniref:Dual-action ribosomal maturation protein DarP n=1 Tax=Fluctibacter halophilus TaxID=226011 RepID=A0ABS8GAP1_9ALTE|nr:ribosome biogenesis factor YjgA [Aestuariibacter halophilus]MCC2617657.1 ribosome-associated protein [Aestuariibacter halophilus]
MTDSDFDIDQDDPDYKSKTQLKQESAALQKLGEKLVNLGQASLDKMPMDSELEEAVQLARRINRKKEGFRRQIQFIGKLLRARETAPLERALHELEAGHRQATQHFHKLEQWRDQLLTQGDSAVQALLEQHPELDRQKLRQLVRQASKQAAENKPPKAARELFQYLKEALPA